MAGPKNERDFEETTIARGNVHLQQLQQQISRAPKIEQVQGEGAPRSVALVEARYVLGRSSRADVVLQCNELSRQHVELVQSDAGYKFKDLDSTNGVFLNGIKAYSASLADGDTLQIGTILFVYHEGRG